MKKEICSIQSCEFIPSELWLQKNVRLLISIAVVLSQSCSQTKLIAARDLDVCHSANISDILF